MERSIVLSGSGSGTSSVPMELFLPPFTDALLRTDTAVLMQDARFKLASDLYSAFYDESSQASRLVTLGMALEVIADPLNKHHAAMDLIDRWRQDLLAAKPSIADNDDALHSLESLERELLVRKEASVRSRIRNTARRLAPLLPEPDRMDLDRDAVSTYDARSVLVHKGEIQNGDIHDLVTKGQRVVKLLLKAYYESLLQA